MDFDIEKTTGSIVIAKPLDTRRKSSYNLTVEVTDGSHTIATQVEALTGDPQIERRRKASLVGMRLQKVFCEYGVLPRTLN